MSQNHCLCQLLICIYTSLCTASIWYKGTLPTEESRMAVGSYNGKIYLLGGTSNVLSSPLIEYSMDTNTFRQILPSPLRFDVFYGVYQFWTQQDNIIYMMKLRPSDSRIAVFDLATLNIPTYTNLPSTLTKFNIYSACLASSPDHLYVTTSYSTTCIFRVLEISSSTWIEVSEMIVSRSRHSCIVHNAYLYQLSGWDLLDSGLFRTTRNTERISIHNITHNNWQMSVNVSYAVTFARVISHEHKIYLIGGIDGRNDNRRMNVVQIIDTSTDPLTVTEGEPMPVTLDAMGVIYVEPFIYVFGGRLNTYGSGYDYNESDSFFYYAVDPTMNPTIATTNPSVAPTRYPSDAPSDDPTINPSVPPTQAPSYNPSSNPSNHPTQSPSDDPSRYPSVSPTKAPSKIPSNFPSVAPSNSPTKFPIISSTKLATIITTKSTKEAESDSGSSNDATAGALGGLSGDQLILSVSLLFLSVILFIVLVIMMYKRCKKGHQFKENEQNIDVEQQPKSIDGTPHVVNDDDVDRKQEIPKKVDVNPVNHAGVEQKQEDIELAQVLSLSLAEEEERKREQIEMMQEYERRENVHDKDDSRAESLSIHDSDKITAGKDIVDDYKQDAEVVMDHNEDMLIADTMEHIISETDSDDDVLVVNDITIGGSIVNTTINTTDNH